MSNKSISDVQEYIANQYHLAVLDYKLAFDKEKRWKAVAEIARLERLAASLVGFAFADALHEKELGA